MQVLASQWPFLANRNAELAVPPLFWPVNCIKIGGHVALLSGPTVYSLYCDSRLHLNAKGSAFLATNFIRFIKGDQHMSIQRPRRSSAEDFHAIANQLLMTLLAGTS